jgi:hypothetical protein
VRARYFAYGSNLLRARMRRRLPRSTAVGVACLDGFRLTWDKRGSDRSGKANLRRAPGGRVWGMVYTLPREDWPDLDACETGYERVIVPVRREGALLLAETYLSTDLTRAAPFSWYQRLVAEGAREQGLPEEWLRFLAACATQPDPAKR